MAITSHLAVLLQGCTNRSLELSIANKNYMINHSNKFITITSNHILSHFCINANNIAFIKVVTGKSNPTLLEIEQYFNDSLDFLMANQLIVNPSSSYYEITDKGKAFHKSGGFKV